MRAKHIAVALTGLLVGLAAIQPGEARVVRLVVEQRTAFVGGADWGKAGPYEMLRGTAYMEADPNNPHDAVVVDLENAPRNAKGLVEFSTQFMILKPVDMQRSNRKIFYAVKCGVSSYRCVVQRFMWLCYVATHWVGNFVNRLWFLFDRRD